MNLSNWLLVLMALFLSVGAIYKQFFLVLSFWAYVIYFLMIEYTAHYYTGMTVTQHMGTLIKDHPYKGYVTVGCFAFGIACLIGHLVLVPKK